MLAVTWNADLDSHDFLEHILPQETGQPAVETYLAGTAGVDGEHGTRTEQTVSTSSAMAHALSSSQVSTAA